MVNIRRRLLRHVTGATSPGSPRAVGDARGRARFRAARRTRFSGLEPFEIGPDTGFVMIGGAHHVTGSARFRRLIEADDYQAATDVALEQVPRRRQPARREHGRDLLDSEQADTTILNLIATEPEVARIRS